VVQRLQPGTNGGALPIAHLLHGFAATGWFDFMNPGSLAAFEAFQTLGASGARGHQKAIIGVIGHGTGLPVTNSSTNKTIVGCGAGQLVCVPRMLVYPPWIISPAIGVLRSIAFVHVSVVGQ